MRIRAPLSRRKFKMSHYRLVDIAPDGQRMLGKLVKYERTPIEIRREITAPGEHNALLLADGNGKATNGGTPGNGEPHRHNGAMPSAKRIGPLDGILVLDFGAYMAGPVGNRLFPGLRARVMHVAGNGCD